MAPANCFACLSPVVIVAGIGFLLKGLFNHMLERDVKAFEARLNSELEIAKVHLQSELNAQLFEFQTRFSFHHQKQTEVIGRTYELLVEAYEQVAQLVHPVQFDDGTSENEKIQRVGKVYNELANYYGKHRIYLSEETCNKGDLVIQGMKDVFTKYSIASRRQNLNDRALEIWDEAWKSMQNEVPELKKELEKDFRNIVAVTKPTTPKA